MAVHSDIYWKESFGGHSMIVPLKGLSRSTARAVFFSEDKGVTLPTANQRFMTAWLSSDRTVAPKASSFVSMGFKVDVPEGWYLEISGLSRTVPDTKMLVETRQIVGPCTHDVRIAVHNPGSKPGIVARGVGFVYLRFHEDVDHKRLWDAESVREALDDMQALTLNPRGKTILVRYFGDICEHQDYAQNETFRFGVVRYLTDFVLQNGYKSDMKTLESIRRDFDPIFTAPRFI